MSRDGPAPSPPAVLVAVHAAAPAVVVREVYAGVEEQGIPTAPAGAVDGGAEDAGAEQLGRHAAAESRLEVGVGVARDGTVAVHHALVPHVLLTLGPGAGPAQVRVLGGDAARIVAGLPLRTSLRPVEPPGRC
ncbi:MULTISPECIES: glycerol dehydratase reactivase beta/small subunit family protein [unclassified Pseudonocardia]|uniref:glycerol dehydratase reactivase beta/small subunit family protein n=1 Tax=unclassified Pseudonocardia TaxID=2619320 RepID=UPI0002D27861|nr:glycerol dehydratase reactivase beta/small subunit family protein [Pseudonocardia sp. Ae707_Ps1]OLM19909.1 Propanediol dehydratase reactivation factor small subunit [Pseudonocardia sp. Ae707_Ps1]